MEKAVREKLEKINTENCLQIFELKEEIKKLKEASSEILFPSYQANGKVKFFRIFLVISINTISIYILLIIYTLIIKISTIIFHVFNTYFFLNARMLS
jgi:hypothetical protein